MKLILKIVEISLHLPTTYSQTGLLMGTFEDLKGLGVLSVVVIGIERTETTRNYEQIG